eukprot:COSAG01_NODE_40134_length_467_cov_1.130435_1_plen_67_part_01
MHGRRDVEGAESALEYNTRGRHNGYIMQPPCHVAAGAHASPAPRFFKQKTAYGILRSDWSSDVCSSD